MAITVDCYVNFGAVPLGSLDQADLAAATEGDFDSWGSGVLDRFDIVANDFGYNWPRPIICAGNTHVAPSARNLRNNAGAGTADQEIFLFLPGGAGAPTVHSMVTMRFVRFDVSNDTGASMNLDMEIVDTPSVAAWSVAQLQLAANDGAINIAAHSNTNSTPGAANAKNKVYLMTHYRDMGVPEVVISLYDPDDDFSLVSTATQSIPANENCYQIRYPSGYIGDPPGFIPISDLVLLYEPTAQDLIDLVTPEGSTVIVTNLNATTLRVG